MGIISTETKDIKTIPEIDNKELNQNKLNIYLIGNVFDTFDGREWLSTAGYTPQESTQSSTEDSFDPESPSLIISTPPKVVAPKYSIDYYETAYAAMRYHNYDSKKAIASIINPIQLDITYNKFFTDCIF